MKKKTFPYDKTYTIFLSTFYIFGLCGIFFNHPQSFSFLIFLILSLFIIFYDIDFKKVLLLFFIFILGLTRAHFSISHESFIDELYDNQAELKGIVTSSKDIRYSTNKVRFYVEIINLKAKNHLFEPKDEKILLVLDNNKDVLKKSKIGDIIKVKGKLRPVYNSSNPYQFDYKKYLLNSDCYSVLYVDNNTLEKLGQIRVSKNLKNDFYLVSRKFETLREKIIEKHSKNIKSPKLEILGGIVFGCETINPDDKIKEQFKNSGLLHLLAASGLNVALIFGIWWYLANLIKIPYNVSILIGCAFVILYTFMTGFPPSILRAGLMLLFVLFGKVINRTASSSALIFFVGFLILLFYPKMLFDIGFQLSFAVTFGLITTCEAVISKFNKLEENYKEKYKNSSRIKKYLFSLFSPKCLVSIVLIPLVAQIWVIPLQMHYFNNFAPYSVLANVLVVPFIGLLSFSGFLGSILALIPKFSDYLVYIFDFLANPLLSLLIKISEIFSSLKYSLIPTMGLNLFQIFLFWGLILVFVLNLKDDFHKKKNFKIFLIMLSIFLLSLVNFKIFNHNLEIMMFDVKNADCFLIKTPKNKYIMIDTAKKSYKGISDARMIIIPYLLNERIKRLETLILTHFDLDHCAGTLDILSTLKAKTIYIQKNEAKSKTSKEILNYLKNEKLNYKIAKNNEIIYKEDDLTIKTFKIDPKNLKNQDKLDNEGSIITLLSYKNKNILFMADSGVMAFSEIKKFLPERIDILKVGHHGAKEVVDLDMIKRINPSVALISTGTNYFGHPHYSTMNLFFKQKVKTISTKNYGFTKVILKEKKDFEIYHFDFKTKKMRKVFLQDETNPFKFFINETFNLEDDNLDEFEQLLIPFHQSNYYEKFIYYRE